jgi:hypothetical protein
MTQFKSFLLKIILLTGLVFPLIFHPGAQVDACTATVTSSPTWTYTPTATATNVPPGVTPAPSLTPTPSNTPAPTLTYEQVFYGRAPVVFRGRVLANERVGEWDESLLVEVHEYYKGDGGSVARVAGVNTFHLCSYFPGTVGTEGVFYVNPGQDGVYYPMAVLGDAPDGAASRSPNGVSLSISWPLAAALGLSTLGSALGFAWMVRPR